MAATATPTTGPADIAGPPRPRRRVSGRKLVILALVAIPVTLVVREGYHVLIGSNLHTVIPGKVYRCAQPNRKFLEGMIRDHGVKTIVNLRGSSPLEPWYQAEVDSTCGLDLSQEDINLSAYRLPSASEMKQLIALLDRTEYPILLHCRRGSDRTGLVAAIVLLLEKDLSLSEARDALSWRFGHVELGRTTHLGAFLVYYHDWLEERQLTHTSAVFRLWVSHEYRGGPCCAVFEHCELPKEPLRADRPFAVVVSVRNGGSLAWRLSPLPTAGAHLKFALYQQNSNVPIEGGKAGFIDAVVEPGERVSISVPLARIEAPGQYRLVLDMEDEQRGDFYQMGSEPLELRLDARE